MTHVLLENAQEDLKYCNEKSIILEDKIKVLTLLNGNTEQQLRIINDNYNELYKAFKDDQGYIKNLEKSLNRQYNKQKIFGIANTTLLVGVLVFLIIK